ncbi:hypothetical protein PUN28_000567 [Cardiocondyla obscurior]|uniref:Secreted protein n=1 Tax=Cardiocondyla obscurior TaxID=286306 RepID=A0AAW2H019_9HYME
MFPAMFTFGLHRSTAVLLSRDVSTAARGDPSRMTTRLVVAVTAGRSGLPGISAKRMRQSKARKEERNKREKTGKGKKDGGRRRRPKRLRTSVPRPFVAGTHQPCPIHPNTHPFHARAHSRTRTHGRAPSPVSAHPRSNPSHRATHPPPACSSKPTTHTHPSFTLQLPSIVPRPSLWKI